MGVGQSISYLFSLKKKEEIPNLSRNVILFNKSVLIASSGLVRTK